MADMRMEGSLRFFDVRGPATMVLPVVYGRQGGQLRPVETKFVHNKELTCYPVLLLRTGG